MIPLLVGVAFGVGSIILFVSGMSRRRVHALITGTPTTPMGELRPGLVEVSGHVESTVDGLRSPYSEKPCAWYELRVEEYVSRGKNGRWVERILDRSEDPVVLRDDTGWVQVLVNRAQLHLFTDHSGEHGTMVPTDAHLQWMLRQRYGFDPEGFIFDKSLRFRETVIEEGELLYALGTARDGGAGGWELVKQDEDLLLVSDRHEEALADEIATSGTWYTLGGVGAAVACVVVLVATLSASGF